MAFETQISLLFFVPEFNNIVLLVWTFLFCSILSFLARDLESGRGGARNRTELSKCEPQVVRAISVRSPLPSPNPWAQKHHELGTINTLHFFLNHFHPRRNVITLCMQLIQPPYIITRIQGSCIPYVCKLWLANHIRLERIRYLSIHFFFFYKFIKYKNPLCGKTIPKLLCPSIDVCWQLLHFGELYMAKIFSYK